MLQSDRVELICEKRMFEIPSCKSGYEGLHLLLLKTGTDPFFNSLFDFIAPLRSALSLSWQWEATGLFAWVLRYSVQKTCASVFPRCGNLYLLGALFDAHPSKCAQEERGICLFHLQKRSLSRYTLGWY